MKKSSYMYLLSFYFFIISIDAKEEKTFEKEDFIKKIIINSSAVLEKIMTVFLKNKIPIALILTISSIIAVIIKIKPLREMFDIMFDNKKEKSRLLKSIIKGLETLPDTIKIIKKDEDEIEKEEDEANEVISQMDLHKVNEAINIIQGISEKAILQEEIKQNKEKESLLSPVRTPNGISADFSEKDMLKYDSNNLRDVIEGDYTTSCIKNKSIVLLKKILQKSESEKKFLLDKFLKGMALLKETSIKKFKEIDVNKMINSVQYTIDINSKEFLPQSIPIVPFSEE